MCVRFRARRRLSLEWSRNLNPMTEPQPSKMLKTAPLHWKAPAAQIAFLGTSCQSVVAFTAQKVLECLMLRTGELPQGSPCRGSYYGSRS